MAQYRETFDTYAGAFPDCNIEIDQFVSEGSTVACHYTFSGTHQGDLAGIPASAKKVSVQGIGIFRLEGAQLVEERVVWNALTMMRQIGAA